MLRHKRRSVDLPFLMIVAISRLDHSVPIGRRYTSGIMPTYVRWREKGASYFFTVVTYRRRRIFSEPASRSLLRTAIESVRERLPFGIQAFVLLPDHLHCIWSLPENDDDFPKRWQQIKGRFSHDYLAAGGCDRTITAQHQQQKRRGIWQPRYWEHRIRDEADYFRYRDYVHLNPVKHGYVEEPGEWPWSSFHHFVQNNWLDPQWPGSSPVDLPEVEE